MYNLGIIVLVLPQIRTSLTLNYSPGIPPLMASAVISSVARTSVSANLVLLGQALRLLGRQPLRLVLTPRPPLLLPDQLLMVCYHLSKYPVANIKPVRVVGTTTHCGKYYEVVSGDDCHLITLSQMIVLSLFQSVNPAVNKDCTSLVPGLYYCVEPTADWNDTDSSTSTTTSNCVTPPAPTPTGEHSTSTL